MQDDEAIKSPDKKYRRLYCPHCNRVSEQEELEKNKWRCCWCNGVIEDKQYGLLHN